MYQGKEKTLRDEIAIEAMKCLMVMPIQELLDMYGHTSVSEAAYEQADSMLLARNKVIAARVKETA